MFADPQPAGALLRVLPGIDRRTLVYGASSLMTEFRMDKGSRLPSHNHPQEQIGYLVKGHVALTIAGEKYDVLPGASWCIPGGAEHSAEILEDSVAIEVFAPVRADYLP